MSPSLPSTFDPQTAEEAIYKRWEDSGYFNPDNLDLPEDAPSYTIILPPPNITDKLHLGHASMLAIEDLIIRYHRMRGKRALWIPGTDHAAIATQNVVEKRLKREEGLTRHDLGRDAFLERVWTFLRETQSTILTQTRRMGASLDWSRAAFTLDEPRQRAVAQMFVNMYEAGAIYRGERIVNWCPRCHSTLADDEVEHAEQTATLYTFRYWKDFPIAISTTRPETKLGDTAIAVNPRDTRYAQYVGKEFSGTFCGVPLTIRVIADREVDMDFGTGAVGVTPAHSMTDWRMKERHDIPLVKVIGEDGTIRNGFGAFSGLTTADAATRIIAHLDADGLIEKREEITNALSVCYRCDTAIEPLPSKQWFVSVDTPLARLGGASLKEKALEVAATKAITFIPTRFTKRYVDWMENLHDWCISRQIWFGHRIPVWYRGEEIHVGTEPPQGDGWTQDPDVLDTWFSSGMWTFSTLGWPETFRDGTKSGDLVRFHPTQVLETGYEILTLWVSRMIMMSLFAVGEIPFEKVYLHGMVLDKHGKKMSKSKGNGIDPMDVIAQYGTDAVRLALLIGNTPGNNMRISTEKIAHFRNFTNKLWNIGRYTLTQSAASDDAPEARTDADHWIMSRLDDIVRTVTDDIEHFRFSHAGEVLRDFTWGDVADWYVETHKVERNDALLHFVFRTLLHLWHPFMPFVTEELFGHVRTAADRDLLMVSTWPTTVPSYDAARAERFATVRALITRIRAVRATYNIPPTRAVPIIADAELHAIIADNAQVITRLARIESVTKEVAPHETTICATISLPAGSARIPLADLIDVEAERKRLTDELTALEKTVADKERRLANTAFTSRAPAAIVAKERALLTDAQKRAAAIRDALNALT